tara:strand:- start:480 stop:830 length:351 start_codon:yes stop_codon:yes gene_type:complete
MARRDKGLQKYTVQEAQNVGLGQAGSIFLNASNTDTINTLSGNFIAITFLEETVFNSTNGLVAVDDNLYPNSQAGAIGIDTDGDAVDAYGFPKGVTIYGRWKQIILVSGSVIAYIG